MPAATAAAPPPVEPPALRSGLRGLRVPPWASDSVKPQIASSGSRVFPTTIAPAARSRRTSSSSVAAGVSGVAPDPWRVGNPATSKLSLMATGTPASASPLLSARASSSSAARRAPSASTSWNAPIRPSSAAMRASASSTTARAVRRPARTSSAICRAVSATFGIEPPAGSLAVAARIANGPWVVAHLQDRDVLHPGHRPDPVERTAVDLAGRDAERLRQRLLPGQIDQLRSTAEQLLELLVRLLPGLELDAGRIGQPTDLALDGVPLGRVGVGRRKTEISYPFRIPGHHCAASTAPPPTTAVTAASRIVVRGDTCRRGRLVGAPAVGPGGRSDTRYS